MYVIYSLAQKKHKVRKEWNFGKTIPYMEKNTRVDSILKEIKKRGFEKNIIHGKKYPIKNISTIHDKKMIDHIRSCQELDENESIYAHVFPYRSYDFNPKTDLKRAGYFCFDVGTQITKHTYEAAKSAVDCALTGVEKLTEQGEKAVFSLCRPPGHHADVSIYGGYCYFNNAAIAAYHLVQEGKVVILDLDFHHGNGTQSIFYEIPNVYFISIHGDPKYYYPYFCGYKTEKGDRLGKGRNWNIPLPKGINNQQYDNVLNSVLTEIKKWKPKYLIVSMGFDTFEKDPVGEFRLTSDYYYEIGRRLASLNIPLLACLEGGYAVNEIGMNAANFYQGIEEFHEN